MSFDVINPKHKPQPKGWSHGMLAPAGGRLLFVAGQTAAGPDGSYPEGFVAQFGAALGNVLDVVREAGGGPEDIGRFTIYVTSRQAYLDSRKPLGAAYQEHMGRHYPAMALVQVAGLVEGAAMVEIEATAVIPTQG